MASIPQTTTTTRTERPGPRVESGPLALLAAVVRIAEKDSRCRGNLGEHAAAWLADIRGTGTLMQHTTDADGGAS